jgi:hypothetical protein
MGTVPLVTTINSLIVMQHLVVHWASCTLEGILILLGFSKLTRIAIHALPSFLRVFLNYPDTCVIGPGNTRGHHALPSLLIYRPSPASELQGTDGHSVVEYSA